MESRDKSRRGEVGIEGYRGEGENRRDKKKK